MVKYQVTIITKRGSKVRARFPRKSMAEEYAKSVKKEMGGSYRITKLN